MLFSAHTHNMNINGELNMSKIVRRECRFATHLPKNNMRPDLHIIKELVTYEDGTQEPRIIVRKNYQRPFYITKKAYRNHNQKKEIEEYGRLDRFQSTQSDLTTTIHQTLNDGMGVPVYRRLTTSPYLYGSDVSSTSLIKYEYSCKDKEDRATPSAVSTFDLEADVVDGTGAIIINSVCSNGVVELGILGSFIRNVPDAIQKINDMAEIHLGDKLREAGISTVIKAYDREEDVIVQPIKRLHADRPDFVCAWNINYDVPLIEERCNKLGMDVADVWRDPKLPRSFNYYKYTAGQQSITSVSGRMTSLKYHAQWHSVETAASFTLICAMTTHRQLRLHKPEPLNYKLDTIMDIEIGERKLAFDDVGQGKKGLAWHLHMQEHHPIEYCVYAIWDSAGLKKMVDKTKDFSVSIPISMGFSDYCNVKKRSKRNDDTVHFKNIRHSQAATLGITTAEAKETHEVYDASTWIITAPAYKQTKGLYCIKEYPRMQTGFRTLNFYLDIVSAYPSGAIITNMSKATTDRDICKVVGAQEEYSFKFEFMNDMSGAINSQKFSEKVFHLPTVDEMMDALEETL